MAKKARITHYTQINRSLIFERESTQNQDTRISRICGDSQETDFVENRHCSNALAIYSVLYQIDRLLRSREMALIDCTFLTALGSFSPNLFSANCCGIYGLKTVFYPVSPFLSSAWSKSARPGASRYKRDLLHSLPLKLFSMIHSVIYGPKTTKVDRPDSIDTCKS